jgi:hypothetical protein
VFCYPCLLSHVLLSIPHSPTNFIFWLGRLIFRYQSIPQALVSFKKYMPPPLLYFKRVNIHNHKCAIHRNTTNASCKMLFYLAKWFQRRRFLEINQQETRIIYGSHVC